MTRPRLAVLADFPAEAWPSMDLCADQLLAHLSSTGMNAVCATRVCPQFRRVTSRLPLVGHKSVAFNADRVLNRFVLYPRHVRRIASQFDLFHVIDHSYAQLVHALPKGRAGVYCHDLDAFRSLLDPAAERRPRWFRALAQRTLSGLQKAAVVFTNSRQTCDQLVHYQLIDSAKLVLAPLGVATEFAPGEIPTSPSRNPPTLLHVGSCIPRKRIDVLLDVLTEVRRGNSEIKLLKVGGSWTPEQRQQVERLGLLQAIDYRYDLSRTELAALYRTADVVLVPSEAEGFGLPVIEGLACGAVVVASDIPALREAGGPAALYAPVGDVAAWSDAILRVLANPSFPPPRADRLAWAAQFTWTANASTIAAAYHRLLNH